MRETFIHFLNTESKCYERTCEHGHITGSAVILSPDKEKILLTHHKKLDKWLQLGGHCDGIKDPFFVAWKEAYEESGLTLIKAFDKSSILDIDRHVIPLHKAIPEHFHYDVCYIFIADPNEDYAVSSESNDLKWVHVSEIKNFCDEPRMHIIADKLKELFFGE